MRRWIAIDDDGSTYFYREIGGGDLAIEQSFELTGRTWATIVDTGDNLKVTSKSSVGEVTYTMDYSDAAAIQHFLMISKQICGNSSIYELKGNEE